MLRKLFCAYCHKFGWFRKIHEFTYRCEHCGKCDDGDADDDDSDVDNWD